VSDRQTDRHTTTAYTVLAWRREIKKNKIIHNMCTHNTKLITRHATTDTQNLEITKKNNK